MENEKNVPLQRDESWWKREVVYQIYPRSFQDSNDDGIGDLRGIVSRLDYLAWLGVGSIWISPIYESPMKDFGYDISDYRAIHPAFGNMEDFELLLREAHHRGLAVILDFVPNHTSNLHPWFLEARDSRDNPKRDWYLWADPAEGGGYPNNWLSVFGGPAWEWDEATGQYYYHAFLKEQPDLNWRNDEVQEAMLDVMRFWLEKGVDGFRIDVLWHLIKDRQLRNNPLLPGLNIEEMRELTYDHYLPAYSTDQPEVHEIVEKMRALTDRYGARVLIGEIYLPINKLVAYYGVNGRGAHLPFNFQLLTLPWDASVIARTIDEYEGALPAEAWPNWVLSNHDNPRISSRVGRAQARIAALLLLTLRGTPTIYYGDEIGMRDVPIPFEEIIDPQGLNFPGANKSRDPARTPMQWSGEVYAGFSKVRPWLRVAGDFLRTNVERQRDDPYSMLSFYRSLLHLRRKEKALQEGAYSPVYSNNQLVSYLRQADDTRFLIILNLTHRVCYFQPREEARQEEYRGVIEISTEIERIGTTVGGVIVLGGDEGIVVRLT